VSELYHSGVVALAYPIVDMTIPVFQALATLAWDPRRARLFRAQLYDALTMVHRGHIDAPSMLGSWAGAMGQPQFMPSSYLAYAVDFDGEGRRDIWTSPADTLASIANYLKGHGPDMVGHALRIFWYIRRPPLGDKLTAYTHDVRSRRWQIRRSRSGFLISRDWTNSSCLAR
jgi:hypothetical protein